MNKQPLRTAHYAAFHFLLSVLLVSGGFCDETEPDATPARESTWQPWEWNGYETFPSLYFAAEPEGDLSDEQMAKISRFSLAILEFRMGQFAEEFTTGLWAGGDLAGFMDEQVRRFKARYPEGPPMLVYRSGMWAGSMYSLQWDALQNQSLFLQDARQCAGLIDYPRDVDESGERTGLSYCRWDFRNDQARDVFADMMAPENIGSADGVFFDNAMSVACDEAQHLSSMSRQERAAFLDAQLASYAEVFSRLVEQNKYPILSTTVGFSDIGAQVPWENDCPAGEEAVLEALDGIPFARNQEFWMWNLGETAARQIRNTIRETQNGIPVIVHMGYFSDDGGCAEGCVALDGASKTFSKDEFLEFGIAAFLVSMGPGSYFGFSDMQNDAEGGGWFDVSWEYHAQYDTIVTGRPVGEVEISEDGMVFTRHFENGTVWVNAADGSYEIDLSSDSDANPGEASVHEPFVLPDVHDPAQLVRVGNALQLYASPVEWWAYSLDDRDWYFLGDDLYDGNNPEWDLGDAAYWAPSIVQVEEDRYRLYHAAVYDEENHGSRIGFAQGVVANGEIEWAPVDDYVVESDGYDQPFAIDPAVFSDDEGRHWLVYGSHAAGIWIVEIDPESGFLAERPGDKRWSADDDRFTHLADYGGNRLDENNIEAAYIYNHPENEFYYLFVNWDRCCSGTDSTYNIRIGRSDAPTGPYLDRDGRPLSDGGGSLFLDRSGEILGDSRFVGPGHAGIYRHVDGHYYFSHHFYDAASGGTPSLALWNLTWDDGWPQIDRDRPVEIEGSFAGVFDPFLDLQIDRGHPIEQE